MAHDRSQRPHGGGRPGVVEGVRQARHSWRAGKRERAHSFQTRMKTKTIFYFKPVTPLASNQEDRKVFPAPFFASHPIQEAKVQPPPPPGEGIQNHSYKTCTECDGSFALGIVLAKYDPAAFPAGHPLPEAQAKDRAMHQIVVASWEHLPTTRSLKLNNDAHTKRLLDKTSPNKMSIHTTST
jgi:hypothetical protein